MSDAMLLGIAAKVREAARRFREEEATRVLQNQTARVREYIADGMAEGASAVAIREKTVARARHRAA